MAYLTTVKKSGGSSSTSSITSSMTLSISTLGTSLISIMIVVLHHDCGLTSTEVTDNCSHPTPWICKIHITKYGESYDISLLLGSGMVYVPIVYKYCTSLSKALSKMDSVYLLPNNFPM
jgi:hypothetical protein